MLNEVVPWTLGADSYKFSHADSYRDVIEMISYGECRGPFSGMPDERIVMYGMNYIINKHFKKKMTLDDIDEGEELFKNFGAGLTQHPYPRDLLYSIVKENDGYMPVHISALPDGTVFYPHNPVYQVTASGKFAKLGTYLETRLTHVWYPITVATLSRHVKTCIEEYYHQTVDAEDFWSLDYRLHDFGYRGTTCEEQAVIGGSAHLLSFRGSDTLAAVRYANSLSEGTTAESIPATEHSIMTSWDTEYDAVMNSIKHFGNGVFAVVADSYDYTAFLRDVLPKVAPHVKAAGGTMVIRPDSGDPIKAVIDGLRYAAIAFGYRVNKKGYRILNNAAVIQGDGIDHIIISQILEAVKNAGYSVQNVAFGMGGGLLQKVNRDTLKFATKLSRITLPDGSIKDIMKAPLTDKAKFSMPGKLSVHEVDNIPVTFPDEIQYFSESSPGYTPNMLKTVWNNGPVELDSSFDAAKQRLNEQWKIRPKRANVISKQLESKISETKLHIFARYAK